MRIALKTLLNVLTWGSLALAIAMALPGKWLQQLQPIPKVKQVALVVPSPIPIWRKKRLPRKILSEAEWTHVLKHARWPRELHSTALVIIECESSNDAHVVGRKDPHDIGGFQVNTIAHWDKIPGQTFEEKKKKLMDPHTNALIALEVYREAIRFWGNGMKPWAKSKKCRKRLAKEKKHT